MSFPRANIKRFNENTGCAPPPGAYDPKQKGKASGGVVDKSERFKAPKDALPGPGSFNVSTVGSTPVKQLFPPSTSQSGKKSKPPVPGDSAKVKELEKEIRRLVKERLDKERDLTHKEEELKKLDGRLHNAQSDRSSLQAKLAVVDKELKDLKKSNDLLKSKVSTAETASKKHEDVHTELSSLKQQLLQKDQEISRLRHDVNIAMATILAEVQMFELMTTSLEDNVFTYVSFVASLDTDKENKPPVDPINKQSKLEDLTAKLKDEKLTENKIKIIKKRTENLQKRFSKALHEMTTLTKEVEGKYSSMVEEHANLQGAVTKIKGELQEAIDFRKSLEEQRDTLLDNNHDLQDQIKQLSTENKNTGDNYRSLMQNIEELQESKTALQHQLEELEKIHVTSQKEDADRIMSLEGREIIINETTANLHERIVELQSENEDLAATLRETGELLCKTKEENIKFEETLVCLEQKWETEKKQFLIQVEELVFEKSRAESQLCDAEEKVKHLQTDMTSQKSESDNQIQGLTTRLEGEKMELSQLQNKLGDLVYEKSQLHTEIGHLEAQLKMVKSESEEMKCGADKALEVVPLLKERVESLSNDKLVIERRAADLTEQNSALQRTLENFQSDFDSYIVKAESDKTETHSKIVSLTEEVDGLKEQKDQMAKELDEWLTDKSELDIEIAKLQCRIKVLEMENNQSKEELELELKKQNDETERVTFEKEQIQKDMEQYGIDLLSNAAQIQSLQSELQSKSTECESIQSKNCSLKQELDQKSSDLADSLSTLTEVRESYSSKSVECELIQTENHNLKQELEQNTGDLTDSMATITELRESYSSKCGECESIMDENDRLCGELKHHKEEHEDLECRLEQTRSDFLKRCDERDELIKKNDAKDKSLAIMSTQVADLSEQVQTVNASLQSKCDECAQLSRQQGETEKELLSAKQQASNYKQQIEDYKEHLQLKCDECDDLQQKYDDLDIELTMSAKEIVDLHERVTSLQSKKKEEDEEKTKQIEKYEMEIADLKRQTETASKNEDMEEELVRLRAQYEDLLAKVEPFMEQINAFEFEKQSLLGLNKDTQAEMERLGNEYAKLLGHQNQKQKIKHIVKIKDENNALKRENVALKEQVSKQKRQLQKLEEPTRKFDTTKAFKHSKENLNVTTTSKSPLRDVNRK